jgi:hypothetical protein
MLLFGPPVQLLSPWPLINYLSVYLFVNSPFITPYHPSAETLDTVVPVIDALTRSFPISGAVLATTSHSNPAIRGSLMYQILLGALSASGGGIVASTFNVFSPEWRISTPPILSSGFLGSLDFVAAAVSSVIFGFLTSSHPVYVQGTQYLTSLPYLISSGGEKRSSGAIEPFMTVLGARSVVVLFLSIVYATKAYVLHGSPSVARVKAHRAKKAAEEELNKAAVKVDEVKVGIKNEKKASGKGGKKTQ